MLTVQEYLDQERCSEIRHEYVEGKLIPMAGSSLVHNRIAGNVHTLLNNAMADDDCEVYMSDVRLRVSPTRYRYPDVMALCGEPITDGENPPSLLNPALIAEVLSSSTADEDQSVKWKEYQTLATLTAYLLIASDRGEVTHYARHSEGNWSRTDYTERDARLSLVGFAVVMPVAEIYRKRVFSKG